MKKTIFTLLCFIAVTFYGIRASAQCQANFNVYQDTTVGAPPSTYLGENLCQPQNMMMADTINYTYTWSWGDGTSTTAPYPSHTYPAAGNYTITLFMISNPVIGCSDSMTINATINKNTAMYSIKIINPNAIPTSVKNVTENQYSIFPNPASDKIYIKGLQNENYNLSIFSMEGKFISSPALQNNQYVSIAELAKGNYILKITPENGKASVLKFFKD